MPDITVCGKCEPTPDALEETWERGFSHTELYLEADTVGNEFELADAISACQDSSVDIQTVHTPHILTPDYEYYFNQTVELAESVGAESIVAHSAGVPLKLSSEISETIDTTVPLAFESSPGESMFYIKNAVFEQGLEFVLDAAHLFAGEPYFNTEFMNLLTDYGDRIPVVHLCDGTRINDGLAPGEGGVPVEWCIKQLKSEYEGTVTLEVMQDSQEEFLELWNNTDPEL